MSEENQSNGAEQVPWSPATYSSNGKPKELTENERMLRVQELVANSMWKRQELIEQLSRPKRNLFESCGYPKAGQLTALYYKDLYDRDPIAARIVELWPKECAQVSPQVFESEDSTEATPFENKWDAISKSLRGTDSFYQDEEGSMIWGYILQADIASRIGRYGIILIGVNDGKPMDQPAEGAPPDGFSLDISGATSQTSWQAPSKTTSGVTQPLTGAAGMQGAPIPGSANSPFSGGSSTPTPFQSPMDLWGQTYEDQQYKILGTEARYYNSWTTPAGTVGLGSGAEKNKEEESERELVFLRVYDESLATVVSWETDFRSKRWNQPLYYNVTLSDPRQMHSGIGLSASTVRVHWSRVIHVAETIGKCTNSETLAQPALQTSVNRVLDIQKILGASAEAFWLGCFMGIAIESNPQLGGEVSFDPKKMAQMMEDWRNELHGRMIALTGFSVKTLAPQSVNPEPMIAVQIEQICIHEECPKRVFMGSERGEMSSGQDDAKWNDRLMRRNKTYVTPKIIVPLIDRLIMLKVLPKPKGYSIKWADLEATSEQQKAAIASQRTGCLNQYAMGGIPNLIGFSDFLTRFMYFSEEEAAAMIGNVEKDLHDQGVSPMGLRAAGGVGGLLAVIGQYNSGAISKDQAMEIFSIVLGIDSEKADLLIPEEPNISPQMDLQLKMQGTQAQMLQAQVEGMKAQQEAASQPQQEPPEHLSPAEVPALLAMYDKFAAKEITESEFEEILKEFFHMDEQTAKKFIEDHPIPEEQPIGQAQNPQDPSQAAQGGDPQAQQGAMDQSGNPAAGGPGQPPGNSGPGQAKTGPSPYLQQQVKETAKDMRPTGNQQLSFNQLVESNLNSEGLSLTHNFEYGVCQDCGLTENWCNQYGGTTCKKKPNQFTPREKKKYIPKPKKEKSDGGVKSISGKSAQGSSEGSKGEPRASSRSSKVSGESEISGKRVEKKVERPSVSGVEKKGFGDGVSSDTPTGESISKSEHMKLNKLTAKLDNYIKAFQKKGDYDATDWVSELKEHIQKVGTKDALSSLPAELGSGGKIEKVHYAASGGKDLTEGEEDSKWLHEYLGKVGISLKANPNLKTISSAPIKQTGRKGDVIPVESNLKDKLSESKALPGLHNTEDLDKILNKGGPETGKVPAIKQLTPQVVQALDDKYGKDKWIVKPYGDEAFAGFGILFPDRVKEIQRNARDQLVRIAKGLKANGYKLAKSGDETVGIKGKDGKLVPFNSSSIAKLDGEIQDLAHMASVHAVYENGAVLPRLPHDALRQLSGVELSRDGKGDVTGITLPNGKHIPFTPLKQSDGIYGVDMAKSPEYQAFLYGGGSYKGLDQADWLHHEIDRAVISSNDSSNVRYMAQPAFEAVGVSKADRAAGNTWETSTEGRVHVTTRNGKAEVIPYATLAHRSDSMPAVFYNKDVHDMEKAVADAIDKLPKSERSGQVYAPDVMKTKDGWKVVELNASTAESGSSLWLEANPMVIDAYVSHLAGRDPAHATFVRGLLTGKQSMKEGPFDLTKSKKKGPISNSFQDLVQWHLSRKEKPEEE